MAKTLLSRRMLLETCGWASAACALRPLWLPVQAEAAEANVPSYLLLCYFNGGWDQLLAFDPRDATRPEFSDPEVTGSQSGIYPAYERVLDPSVQEVLTRVPSGVQMVAGSPLTFGPAVPQSLLEHATDFSLLRGIDMGTLAHEAGRRYLLTGRFPQGLAANGSSLSSVVANQLVPSALISNLSIRVEAFNQNLPARAAAMKISNVAELRRVLSRGGKALPAGSEAAVGSFAEEEAAAASTSESRAYLAQQLRSSRAEADAMVASGAAGLFQFTLSGERPPSVQALFDHFDIRTAEDLDGPPGQAALAAQALTGRIAKVVSVQLSAGLDTHFDTWASAHAPRLQRGLDALGRLLKLLKDTHDSDGKSFFSRTTVLAFSEFARSAALNANSGRDHHLASSALVCGPGLIPNQVIGGTSDNRMAHLPIDFTTGKVDPAGSYYRPLDIHATLLQSMGFDHSHLTNLSPRLIRGLLR